MSKTTSALVALGVVAGLGVASLPLSTYAKQPTPTDPAAVVSPDNLTAATDTKINALIEETLSIDTSADVVNLNEGNSFTGTPLNVTVKTNYSKGYSLAIAGKTDTNLTSKSVATDKIVAFSKGVSTPDTLATENSKSTWGFTVTGDDIVASFKDTGVGKYAGVPATAADGKIAGTTAPTAKDGNATAVTFKAAMLDNQAAGEYEGTVTFTASNNID